MHVIFIVLVSLPNIELCHIFQGFIYCVYVAIIFYILLSENEQTLNFLSAFIS